MHLGTDFPSWPDLLGAVWGVLHEMVVLGEQSPLAFATRYNGEQEARIARLVHSHDSSCERNALGAFLPATDTLGTALNTVNGDGGRGLPGAPMEQVGARGGGRQVDNPSRDPGTLSLASRLSATTLARMATRPPPDGDSGVGTVASESTLSTQTSGPSSIGPGGIVPAATGPLGIVLTAAQYVPMAAAQADMPRLASDVPTLHRSPTPARPLRVLPPSQQTPSTPPVHLQQCIVCASRVDVVLAPCGHRCLCATCAPQTAYCPLCRQPIRELLRPSNRT